jgi:hypothetical protein
MRLQRNHRDIVVVYPFPLSSGICPGTEMTQGTLNARMMGYAFATHRGGISADLRNNTEAMVEGMVSFLLSLHGGERVLKAAGVLDKDARVDPHRRQRSTAASDGRMDLSIPFFLAESPHLPRPLILELKVQAALSLKQVSSYRRESNGIGLVVVICPAAEQEAIKDNLIQLWNQAGEEGAVGSEINPSVVTYEGLARAAADAALDMDEADAWRFVSDFVAALRAPTLPLPVAAPLTSSSVAEFYSTSLRSLASASDQHISQAEAITEGSKFFADAFHGKPMLTPPPHRSMVPSWTTDAKRPAWMHARGTTASPPETAWDLVMELDPSAINRAEGGLVWYLARTSTPVEKATWMRSTIGRRPADEAIADAAAAAGEIVWEVLRSVVGLHNTGTLSANLERILLDGAGSSGIALVDRTNKQRRLEVRFSPLNWAENPDRGPMSLLMVDPVKLGTSWDDRERPSNRPETGEDYVGFVLDNIRRMWGTEPKL